MQKPDKHGYEREKMKTLSVLLAVSVLVAGCGASSDELTPTQTKRLLHFLFQTSLPHSMQSVRGHKISLFTTCIQARFVCDPAEFSEFLEACNLLPDQLEAGAVDMPTDAGSSIEQWWKPGLLEQPRGVRAQWQFKNHIVDCCIKAGQSSESPMLTVYMLLVMESKSSTSARPELKADPTFALPSGSAQEKGGS